ncbi:hypothetical protein B4914_05065 [Yersinia entomophaga]|nr:hypothetical protein B4914_05065 [Yersinia entomophaga]
MRPIRPKPLIPTLIVIYSTSYLLVNKRLVVKLQKPHRASSGIVSILAANQTKRASLHINHTFLKPLATFLYWGEPTSLKGGAVNFAIFITLTHFKPEWDRV